MEKKQVIQKYAVCGRRLDHLQVPQFLLEDCADHSIPCRIYVTQPRRVAASSVAEYVARSRGWDLGRVVGYQIGGNRDCISDECLIRFVTPGVLFRQVLLGIRTKEVRFSGSNVLTSSGARRKFNPQ
jgi:hypothetical protein